MVYEVVVCRFMEPWSKVRSLHDLLNETFKNVEWKMTVYDRSGEEPVDELFPENVERKVCENIGRESYVVLKHIHDNFDSLCDYTFFIPANWDNHHRRKAVENIRMWHGRFPFLPINTVRQEWSVVENFVMDEWVGVAKHGPNHHFVASQTYVKSKDRPFGTWYAKNIPVPWKHALVWNGTFAVAKDHILRYTKEQYHGWLRGLAVDGPNPEQGHYWERVWYSLFS